LCIPLQTFFNVLALLYLLFFAREPMKKVPRSVEERNRGEWLKRLTDFIWTYLVDPMLQMIKTTFRLRPRNLRFLILLQGRRD
jgi:hypothetical protein